MNKKWTVLAVLSAVTIIFGAFAAFLIPAIRLTGFAVRDIKRSKLENTAFSQCTITVQTAERLLSSRLAGIIQKYSKIYTERNEDSVSSILRKSACVFSPDLMCISGKDAKVVAVTAARMAPKAYREGWLGKLIIIAIIGIGVVFLVGYLGSLSENNQK